MQEYGIVFAVRQVELGYHRPAHFNEMLEVSARIAHRGKASLTFHQEVRRQQDHTLLCSGQIKIACLKRDEMRPTPIPSHLLQEILHVE
jgi:acyl-CoA thioester hydrolase